MGWPPAGRNRKINILWTKHFGTFILFDSAGVKPCRNFARHRGCADKEDDGQMTPPADFDSLKLRLVEIQPELPKRLQQVAAFALEHPDEMALGTAASVAGHAHVQASTLVRFAQAIGFSGLLPASRVPYVTLAPFVWSILALRLSGGTGVHLPVRPVGLVSGMANGFDLSRGAIMP